MDRDKEITLFDKEALLLLPGLRYARSLTTWPCRCLATARCEGACRYPREIQVRQSRSRAPFPPAARAGGNPCSQGGEAR
jgi:hypothetical protein